MAAEAVLGVDGLTQCSLDKTASATPAPQVQGPQRNSGTAAHSTTYCNWRLLDTAEAMEPPEVTEKAAIITGSSRWLREIG